MPGKPVRIGPFVDGLNNVSLSGESKDTELVEMINFEVGPDNLLWSRPPYETVATTVIDGTTVTGQWKVLGIYRTSLTEWYAIVLKPKTNGTKDVLAYVMGDFSLAPTLIKNIPVNDEVTGFVQFNQECFFLVSPVSSIECFKWQKSGVATNVPAMKKGFSIIVFQSRIWVGGIDTATQQSRIYFSSIGVSGPDPSTWNTTVDFFDAAPGEGGFVTGLLAVNSSIIVFKNDGTWRFSYPASPSKGQLVKLNGTIGAANSSSMVEFDNYVYVYDQGRVYEVVNNTFTQLNRFVKFEKDLQSVDAQALGVDLSIMGRRLIVRYFSSIYAYNIDSRSWSQWRSVTGTPGKLFALPVDSTVNSPTTYLAASTGTLQAATSNLIPPFTSKQAFIYHNLIEPGNSVTSVGTTLEVYTAASSKIVVVDQFPVSAGQKFLLTGTITKTAGDVKGLATYTLRDGSKIFVTQILTDTVSQVYNVPDGTIEMALAIVHNNGADMSYTMTGMNFARTADPSPVSLMRLKNEYNELPITLEHISCRIRTKAYDFQVASTIKRLFWWGMDIKTTMPVSTKINPVAVKLPVTWGKLREYTHLQLRAGTWGNPLSFLTTNLSVVDGGDPANAVTENGRIFVKLIKSLRFRQLSFEVEMQTLGTKATGPCKIHTLTAYVAPKEKVVDKFN